jgi:hypothetical protein
MTPADIGKRLDTLLDKLGHAIDRSGDGENWDTEDEMRALIRRLYEPGADVRH